MHKKSFRRAKSSVFKTIIPNNTTPTFQKVDGVTLSLIFVDGIRNLHGIALFITELIDFYSQCSFKFFFATVFN